MCLKPVWQTSHIQIALLHQWPPLEHIHGRLCLGSLSIQHITDEQARHWQGEREERFKVGNVCGGSYDMSSNVLLPTMHQTKTK